MLHRGIAVICPAFSLLSDDPGVNPFAPALPLIYYYRQVSTKKVHLLRRFVVLRAETWQFCGE